MAFEEGSAELSCPSCSADHIAKWSRMPVREQQRIRCKACKGVLFEGNTHRDYFQVNLVPK